MKMCLVIGGAGFIGRHVTRMLCELGREVVVLGRREYNSPHPGCRYICGNYGDRELLRNVLQAGCEVINLAYSTIPKTSYDDPVFDVISNLPASVGLFQEALAAQVSRIVLVSSGGTVYGPQTQLPIREDFPTTPISPYGITKLTIDRYAIMFHRTARLPVVVVRPANAYGEDQQAGKGQGFIATAIAAILAGNEVEVYGSEGTIRDYIHVSDVATGIVAALNHGNDGEIYNLGTGRGHSNAEVLKIIGNLAQKEGIPVRTKILPPRQFDVEANILDGEKLHVKSGWQPICHLEEGIQKIWQSRLAKGAGV